MPLSRAASAREWPSRIKAFARRRRTTAPSCIPAASSRSSLAENSRRVISIGLPICMTLCEALQAAQNRGTVDSAIPARIGLSVGWYKTTASGTPTPPNSGPSAITPGPKRGKPRERLGAGVGGHDQEGEGDWRDLRQASKP